MKLIHVVRRYGPVGGMERYVWETTHELAKAGHQVQILCERCAGEPAADIAVHALGEMFYRPRWLYYWRFGRRVERWLQVHPQPGWLIHSHERVGVHAITTIHGPPFASVRDKPWWKRVSIRVAMQLYLERRELRVPAVIVPNSEIIARQLARYYPEYVHKLTRPVVPGVVPGVVRWARPVPAGGGVVGFVGKEWKRKGLPLAIDIVAHLRQRRPDLMLWVVGPPECEIRHLFADWPAASYRLLGWRQDSSHFQDVDILLHPAKAEPYGMVISEAMAASVPVVVSDACGAAAQVSVAAGEVLSLDVSVAQWASAVERQLERGDAPPAFVRGWDVVALEFVSLYAKLNSDSMPGSNG